MTMFCQHCGAGTKVMDTIGEGRNAVWREKIKPAMGVLRLRQCANGHQFETIEIRREAYDALVSWPPLTA